MVCHRVGRFSLSLWALLALAGAGYAEDAAPFAIDLDADQRPDTKRPEDKHYLDKKKAMEERNKQFRGEKQAELKTNIAKVEQERAEKITPIKSDSVKIDEQTIPVTEPRSMEESLKRPKIRDEFEISPEDFELERYERWALNKSDFQFDRPQYFVANFRQGHVRRWFGFLFRITNSSTKPRRIAPVFVAVNNKGVFQTSVDGFLPERYASDSSFHPLAESKEARDTLWQKDNVVPLETTIRMLTERLDKDGFKRPTATEKVAVFHPGQMRYGIALWPDFSDDWTELKIVVNGLNNAYRFDRKQRRALVLSFQRNDDEFHVEREELQYLAKDWEYLWMWDQDVSVPIPVDPTNHQIKDKTINTPAGGQRLLVSFPWTIANSSGTKQALTLKQIRLSLRGKKSDLNWSGFTVSVGEEKLQIPEVQLVDDGKSSIYKAAALRDLGAGSEEDQKKQRDRFVPDAEPLKAKRPGGRLHQLEPGAKLENNWAVFDAMDIDKQHLFQQVESLLSLKMDKVAAAAEGWKQVLGQDEARQKSFAKSDPGVLYDPARRLTDDVVLLKNGQRYLGEVVRDDESWVFINTGDKGNFEFDKASVEKVEKGEKTAVLEQIRAAIPEAIAAAKADKKIAAEFQIEAGLATGQFRISRSYRQLGKIEEEWLNAWENLDKAEK